MENLHSLVNQLFNHSGSFTDGYVELSPCSTVLFWVNVECCFDAFKADVGGGVRTQAEMAGYPPSLGLTSLDLYFHG